MKRTRLRKKGKSETAKLKGELWQLCRKIVKLQHPHVCYTCGAKLIDGTQNFHIGHFISKSICSTDFAYNIENLRPQCSGCNVWRSGNWVAFERHLIEDGTDVEDLKKRNEEGKGKKYDATWLKDRVESYTQLLEQLS